MMLKINARLISLLVAVFISFLTAVIASFAWNEPLGKPPQNNSPAPLNISAENQTKLGTLTFPAHYGLDSTYFVNPSALVSAVFRGNVGINNLNPDVKLAVGGDVKISSLAGGGIKEICADNQGKLVICPSSFTIVGSLYFVPTGFSIFISGNYLYATFDQGMQPTRWVFHIYDISNPTQPVRVFWNEPVINDFTPAGSALDVFVSGQYAYVLYNSSQKRILRIYDVSNPASPILLGGQNLDFYSFPGIAVGCGSIYVQGNFAYVLCGRSASSSSLHIIDVSNPANPFRIGSLTNLPRLAREVVVTGNYAYATFFTNDPRGFRIIDVSNPASPTIVGGSNLNVGALNDVSVIGDKAYVVGDGGLKIINVSNPFSPTIVGSINPIPFTATTIFIEGNNAYVGFLGTGSNVFRVVDVSNPSNLKVVGGDNLSLPSSARDNFARNKYIFMIFNDYSNIQNLKIIKAP